MPPNNLSFSQLNSPQAVAQRKAAKADKNIAAIKANAPSRKDLVRAIKKRVQSGSS